MKNETQKNNPRICARIVFLLIYKTLYQRYISLCTY